jgi:uncharacterized protein
MKDDILEKREEANALFEVYQGLLTPSQKDVFSDYYALDLSLSEIAENRVISRAAVSDSLKQALNKMREAELQLSFLKKKGDLRGLCAQVETAPDEMKQKQALQALEEYIHHGL